MRNSLIRKCTPIIIFLVGVLVLFSSYQYNVFRFSPKDTFINFQRDSESLGLGTIIADTQGIDKKSSHLGLVSKNKDGRKPESTLDSYAIFGHEKQFPQLTYFGPYKSQFGLQGIFYSKIKTIFAVTNFHYLQYIPSLLFAVAVLLLGYCYRYIYGTRFACIFLAVFVLSPWIINFARNLYWSPVTWLLPALFAAILFLTENRLLRCALYFLIGLAIFIKSLCGYEYISTIMLFTISVFLVGPYFNSHKPNQRPDLQTAFWVGVVCLLGFMAALLVHANIRGDTLLKGLQNIYEIDVKRRTYGDPLQFAPENYKALIASPVLVLGVYTLLWPSKLLAGIPGLVFPFLILFSLWGLWIKFKTKNLTFKRDAILFLVMASVPCSWFVLAKAHSYVHTHMNYVLWYYGFVPALFYLSGNSCAQIGNRIRRPFARFTLHHSQSFTRWLKETAK